MRVFKPSLPPPRYTTIRLPPPVMLPPGTAPKPGPVALAAMPKAFRMGPSCDETREPAPIAPARDTNPRRDRRPEPARSTRSRSSWVAGDLGVARCSEFDISVLTSALSQTGFSRQGNKTDQWGFLTPPVFDSEVGEPGLQRATGGRRNDAQTERADH